MKKLVTKNKSSAVLQISNRSVAPTPFEYKTAYDKSVYPRSVLINDNKHSVIKRFLAKSHSSKPQSTNATPFINVTSQEPVEKHGKNSKLSPIVDNKENISPSHSTDLNSGPLPNAVRNKIFKVM